jgi:hypothetical protein
MRKLTISANRTRFRTTPFLNIIQFSNKVLRFAAFSVSQAQSHGGAAVGTVLAARRAAWRSTQEFPRTRAKTGQAATFL